jgi:2-dehydropantoate 2-reductase
MRILMVGAGATGGYYGGRLVQAARDVTFLVRGKRLEQLQKDGLQIVSPLGDATLRPKLITAADLPKAGPFDLVLISTKAYSLDAAIDDFAPAVGPDTIIMPLLNGMRHLDVLSERFGRERLMGGSVRIVADVDEQGRVHMMSNLDELTFGELDGNRTPRAEALYKELAVFGYATTLSDDMVGSLWQKWWILATMGCVGVVSGGTVGDMMATPHGGDLARAILAETTSISAANGYPADDKMLGNQTKRMTDPASTLTSSMFRDYSRGLPVEADHILGDLLARARGVAAPLILGAYTRLKVYEAKRQK